MQFSEAVKRCFTHFTDGVGRADRSEWGWFTLFAVLVGGVAYYLLGGVFGLVLTAAVLVPWFGAMVRRLHDSNHSGDWVFLILVPGGVIPLLVLLLLPGSKGGNRYGWREV